MRFDPEIILSFGTPYPAITAWLLRKPHISINDTEHAKMHHFLTVPFSQIILTPSCYNKDLGKKQIRFYSYMELCYLYPKYLKPDNRIFDYLNIPKGTKHVIFRFVFWNALHDRGHQGLTLENKILVVEEYAKICKIFVSAESELPAAIKKYKIKISPEKIQDVLY